MIKQKKQDIKKILTSLKNAKPTLVIDYSTSSQSDVIKYKLCQEFIKILKSEDITQVELAKKLKVDKAIVNKIVLHRIDYFTIDRLIDLLSKVSDLELTFKAS